MKYLIRIFVIVLISIPILASAQILPKLVVCDPSPFNGSSITNKTCDFSALLLVANNIIKFLIIIGTSIFSVVFMYAGFLYLTAVGDTGKISKAHGLFWNAIIGFVIMLAAWLLVDFILTALVKSDLSKYKILGK
jgi:hypothetical protein